MPGDYIVKPLTNDDYVFLSAQSVKIQKSNVKDRNFNGLYRKDITDPVVKDIVKENMITDTFDPSLTSWLEELAGNERANIPNIHSGVPIASRYALQNSICGNGKTEENETCDDGTENGKRGFCSSDCLYRSEIRFSDEGIQSNAVGYNR